LFAGLAAGTVPGFLSFRFSGFRCTEVSPMLEKIPRAARLRAMIVVSLIPCSPGFLSADSPSMSSDANSPLDAYLVRRIQQFQSDPAKIVVAKPIEAPPGMPIGED
jgi:hypothetical protein